MLKEHRRHFMKQGIAAGVGFWAAGHATLAQGQNSKSPNQQLQFACIGVGGKGKEDSADAGLNGKVVGICDIDERALSQASLRFPEASKHFDFREMLLELGDKVDAVTVTTPDHCHAVAAIMAMKMGKHVYCQKPLTRTISEAREMRNVAKAMGVTTQMGNQGTAKPKFRQGAAVLKSGCLGKIKEVHVWTNRPIWPQGGDRPKETPPIPNYLHWYEWLGPAHDRPYHPDYHPFSWRGYWDFGTGALGDMACHTLNMPFMGVDLRDPVAVESQTSGHNGVTFPAWSIIKFDFPANANRGPVRLTWYDGGKRPGPELMKPEYIEWVKSQHPDAEAVDDLWASGALVVGEAGVLFAPDDYAENYKLFGVEEPKVEFTAPKGHFVEFADAIHNGTQAVSNFPDYAGPLTETILLGNLSVYKGERIEWDAASMTAKGHPELDVLIRPKFREGYSYDLAPNKGPA